jgi:ribosomal protein L11 methyltransferase
MRRFAALDLDWTSPAAADAAADLLMALLDDYGPTALEEAPGHLRAFFASNEARDRAAAGLARALPELSCTPVDVPDEGWAERSQASIGPVAVGRIVVAPPWTAAAGLPPGDLVLRIQPSMGFGTGHHASTRLCLDLLQRIPVKGRSVLDVGTGSGVLALAAWRLGASPVTGMDSDPDALAAATESLALNEAVGQVALRHADLADGSSAVPDAPCDIVLANLTAAALERHAALLTSFVRPDGALVTSGYEPPDVPGLTAAFGALGWRMAEVLEDAGWIGAIVVRATTPRPSRAR